MESTQEDLERLIPLNQAIRQQCPDITASPATWWRWTTKGLAGNNGERIRLRVQYLGRTPCTTLSDIRAWMDQVTAARLARMQQRAQREADVTTAELEAAGLVSRARTQHQETTDDADTDARLAAHGLTESRP